MGQTKENKEKKIFKQFLYNNKLSFSQIHHKTKIDSNLLAYFLKRMLSKGLLEKSSKNGRLGKYKLTSKGEKMIPFYTEAESLNPLVVVLLMIIKNGKVLLIQREERPYKGLFGLPSGRMLLSESISETAERICKQKLLARAKAGKVKAVVHEKFFEVETKHAFVFFIVEAELLERSIEHLGVKWFNIKELPKRKVISSDYWLIKNKSGESSQPEVIEEVLENNGKKIRFV